MTTITRRTLEPIAHLKFGMAEDGPGTPATSFEDWMEDARGEFHFSRLVVPILNGTDEELAERIRQSDNPTAALDALVTMAEDGARYVKRYRAGIEIMECVSARIFVVAERMLAELNCSQ